MTIKCPDCNKEIEGIKCPDCRETTPSESRFCINCGSGISQGQGHEQADYDDSDFDFENRVLCPDGACTGIIINGKCSECGKASKG